MKHALHVLCLSSRFSSKKKCLSFFLPPLNSISGWIVISLLEIITDSTTGQIALEGVLCFEKIEGLCNRFLVTVVLFLLRKKNAVMLLSRSPFFESLLFVAPHRRKSFIELHRYHVTFGCGLQNRCENLVIALTIPLPGNLGMTHFT